MAKPPPNLEFSKEHHYPQKAKGMSFFAFLFSITIYISIFYIFNLSPSTLLNNTKFWFFISNTLIIIIAADYGAFSSYRHKLDLYEEYLRNSQSRTVVSSFPSQYPQIVRKNIYVDFPKEEAEIWEDKREVVSNQKTEENPEHGLEIVIRTEVRNPDGRDIFPENEPEKNIPPKSESVEDDDHPALEEKKIEARTYRRSKSDKVKKVVIEENKNVLRRVETQREEPKVEENEFSRMSDEELNRRVEEFIQRFNRQIRLQASSRKLGQVY